ncbi:MAG: hypothetical protein ABUJ92_15010, partial [Desulfobacterales bacterium]
PDLQKLILYNNFDITKIDFSEPPFTLEELQEQYGPDLGWQLSVLYENFQVDITRSLNGTFQYKDLIPKINIKDLILLKNVK